MNGLLEHDALTGNEVIVTNRTIGKLDKLKKDNPEITVGARCAEAASADIIFICVRTEEVKATLEEMLPQLGVNAHIVTINGGLQIKNLERVFPGKITKAIPSMTMGSGHGVTLICHNSEEQFEVAADLTSCAPAFIVDIVQRFAQAAVRHSDLDEESAGMMLVETLLGTALTFSSGEVTLDELKSKVATKGGISEQGLKVLDRELPRVFDKIIEATVMKHEAVKRAITASSTSEHAPSPPTVRS